MREGSASGAVFPENFAQTLRLRHGILKRIRSFFDESGYLEVETPLRVKCPGADFYIDALPADRGFFLATSPELHMKRLLSLKIDRIYQFTHSFRAEEEGHLHSTEFAMLEWYRAGTDYMGIMQETELLLRNIVGIAAENETEWTFPFKRITVSELYRETAGWDPVDQWDEDRYFSDWERKVEPELRSMKAFFLMNFPAPLAALSKTGREDPRICERFELFLDGVEIANAFTELTDVDEHARRFAADLEKRDCMGKAHYPRDESFMRALKAGIPECGGIAVGIDRLVMALLGISHIDQVQTFPMSRI